MHQAIRQHLIVTYAISLGLMAVCMSLFQPIPSASAQQLTGTVSQPTIGTSTQKKDAQTSIRKPHRLIRKLQSALTATLQPIPLDPSSKSTASTVVPTSALNDTTTQSKEPSSLNRSVGAAVPLATMSVAPSSTTTTGSIAVGTTSTGTIPLAAAGAGNSSTSGSGSAGGRSMSRLAAEMPGLTQLLSPSSVPVVSVNPAIGANPTSLSFAATQGGANPAAQTLSISNTGGGTLSWSASDSAAWLTLSPASGTGNGTVTLTAATGTLVAGNYPAVVTMSATGASPVTVPVTFTVATAPVPPAIGASPTSLSFAATQGGANPANQTLSISNTGGGTLNWSANDSAAWLTLSPASGTGNGTVTLSAATGTLTAGSYSNTVTLSGGTGVTPVTVPVTFTVNVASTLNVSPASLTYAATQGAANPSNQSVTVTNTGGTLNWTASDNASWLSLAPASGSGNGTLTASVNTAGLAAGTYNGTITVAASGTASQTVGVALTVNAPATSSATLMWNANTDPDLAGYKVDRATASGAYGAPVATLQGNVTNYVAAGLQVGTTYYFVVTAYDSASNESLRSNEVSKSIF